MRLLLASNNAKKLRELDRVLTTAGVAGVSIVGLSEVKSYPEPKEDCATFEENALIKARAGARASGLPTIADDSGLTVDALNGMPGILSARWSGRHGDDAANNQLLLAQLADTPDERRGAAFVSVCALVTPNGREEVARGEWSGRLLREPVGENGFGYDPLFVPAEAEPRSSAQLSPEEKDALSHRGRALAQLVPVIAALAGQ